MLRFLSRRRKARKTGEPAAAAAAAAAAEPIKAKRSAANKNLIQCRIVLLDGTDLSVDLTKKAMGSDLYEQVFYSLDLIEKDYFGLQFTDANHVKHWLDPTKAIKKQVKIGPPFTLRLRVKFYSSEPNKLREELTRYQFFLQLKLDVLDGRVECDEQRCARMCALLLQSELGDYDALTHTAAIVSEFRFVPAQTEALECAILSEFPKFRGMSPADAETAYLNEATWLDRYGVDMHTVSGKDGCEYELGLTPAGIQIYEHGHIIGRFLWPNIRKLDFRKKKLTLLVATADGQPPADGGQPAEDPFVFRLHNEKACKHLWKCAVEHHTFFRLRAPIADPTARQNFFRLGSRFRYTGRTQSQAAELASVGGGGGGRGRSRQTVQFERRPSQRFAGRQSHVVREQQRPVPAVEAPLPVVDVGRRADEQSPLALAIDVAGSCSVAGTAEVLERSRSACGTRSVPVETRALSSSFGKAAVRPPHSSADTASAIGHRLLQSFVPDAKSTSVVKLNVFPKSDFPEKVNNAPQFVLSSALHDGPESLNAATFVSVGGDKLTLNLNGPPSTFSLSPSMVVDSSSAAAPTSLLNGVSVTHFSEQTGEMASIPAAMPADMLVDIAASVTTHHNPFLRMSPPHDNNPFRRTAPLPSIGAGDPSSGRNPFRESCENEEYRLLLEVKRQQLLQDVVADLFNGNGYETDTKKASQTKPNATAMVSPWLVSADMGTPASPLLRKSVIITQL